ncbi:MAG: hypothetical protein F6K19_06740 [Cyanothece sp. SIO1E1]|nr:hypothetical protein [Cyanothece sp. SIO1E1]
MKKRKAITVLFVGTLILSLLSCSMTKTNSTELSVKERLEQLSGTYLDLVPYNYGQAFGQRVFTFDNGKWTLRFTLGLDPQLQQKVFQFRTFGTYEVLDKSLLVPTAYNALFLEEKKFLTLLTDNQDLIGAFGLGNCQLEQGKEKDISEDGCALWAAVEVCQEDHDLLALDAEGLLYFGVRPPDNNMCTADRRPITLTPPVSKQ